MFNITITDEAKQELIFLKEDKPETPNLRVWVSSGGCSGLNYGMSLVGDDDIEEKDAIIDCKDFKILVDHISQDYLDGSVIEWKTNDLNSGFKINNPNEISGCGCGNSFSTSDEDSKGCGSCHQNGT